MNDQLSTSEIAELRAVLAERQSFPAAELAFAVRSEQRQALDIEAAKRAYWSLILDGAELTLPDFKVLLNTLGRSVGMFESDQRAVRQQRQAEAQREADSKLREEILSRAAPAQAKLDEATTTVFGEGWSELVNRGDLTAPYLVDYEAGTVTTQVAMLKAPCAELEQALVGISGVFRYRALAAPSFLEDAKANFQSQVATHVAKRISA